MQCLCDPTVRHLRKFTINLNFRYKQKVVLSLHYDEKGLFDSFISPMKMCTMWNTKCCIVINMSRAKAVEHKMSGGRILWTTSLFKPVWQLTRLWSRHICYCQNTPLYSGLLGSRTAKHWQEGYYHLSMSNWQH